MTRAVHSASWRAAGRDCSTAARGAALAAGGQTVWAVSARRGTRLLGGVSGRYRAVSSGHTARYGPGRRRRGTPPRSPSLAGKPGGLVPGLRCGPEHIDAHSAQGTPLSGTRCGNGFRREHGPVGRHNDGLTADAIAAVLTALPAPGARSRSRASGRPPRPPAVAGSRAAAPAAAVPRSQGETSGWLGDPARPARA